MKTGRVPILALIAAATLVSPAIADSEIVVAAQETGADVTPLSARMRLVSLPPLTFQLRAAIRCDGVPISVTLSIADTFATQGREQLEGLRATEASLTVPAQQLALAANSHFCIKDDDETGDEMLIPGFATAHASLQCENDSGVTVHYASAPLKVRLSCARELIEKDQVSSSDK